VTGTAPGPGRVLVEIARRRDTVVPIGSRKSVEEWRETYARANDLVVARGEAKVAAGEFRVEIDVPADAKPGPGYVRTWFGPDPAGGAVRGAAGGRYVEIALPAGPESPR
jgi:hypothetical protein